MHIPYHIGHIKCFQHYIQGTVCSLLFPFLHALWSLSYHMIQVLLFPRDIHAWLCSRNANDMMLKLYSHVRLSCDTGCLHFLMMRALFPSQCSTHLNKRILRLQISGLSSHRIQYQHFSIRYFLFPANLQLGSVLLSWRNTSISSCFLTFSQSTHNNRKVPYIIASVCGKVFSRQKI